MGHMRGSAGLTFGVSLSRAEDGADVRRAAEEAERAGLDVLTAADHLGAPEPFALLAAAATVTSRIRLRTYVLDVYFWNPALLARAAATVDALSGGRLDLGLGAGHMKHEHDEAGLPFPPHADRVADLERILLDVRRRLGGDHHPAPVQRPVPVVVGGWGERTLRVAARHADVVALAGIEQLPGRPPGTFRPARTAETADRIRLLGDLIARERPADAAAPVLDALLQHVVLGREPEAVAEELAAEASAAGVPMDPADLLDSPFVLYARDAAEAAGELAARCDRYGITSWCTHTRYAAALAEVAAQFR